MNNLLTPPSLEFSRQEHWSGPEKDLESHSSMRLEALVPSRDSRAMTRSPSPCAWRPDFPGTTREQGFLSASRWGPAQSLWGPAPGEADRPAWPCGASAAFRSSRAHCVCRRARRWPCAPAAPHSLRVRLLCSLENATNSADAATSKFVFGQNMSERVLVSDPVGTILGAQRLSEPPAGHRGTGVCLLCRVL